MSASLRQLLTVRSQAAELLLAYLKGVEQTLARTPLLERFGQRLAEGSLDEALPVPANYSDGLIPTTTSVSLPRIPLRVRAFNASLDRLAASDHEWMCRWEYEIPAKRTTRAFWHSGRSWKDEDDSFGFEQRRYADRGGFLRDERELETAKALPEFLSQKVGRSRKTSDTFDIERSLYADHIGSRRDECELEAAKPLTELLPKLEYLVLIGDPGSGKTEWLKGQAVQWASRARLQIESSETQIEAVPLPIFLRLDAVNDAFALSEPSLLHFLTNHVGLPNIHALNPVTRLRAALLKALHTMEPGVSAHPDKTKQMSASDHSPIFLRYAWRRLATRNVLLCLDAWDEVRGDRSALAQSLHSFAKQGFAGSIYLSSRIVGYDPAQRPLPVESKLETTRAELRILGLGHDERRCFVEAFFMPQASGSEKSEHFLRELGDKPAVDGLTQNLLLLTLMCLAATHELAGGRRLNLPPRRSDLYHIVLRGMLGEWSGRPGSSQAALSKIERLSMIEIKLDCLTALAGKIFPKEIVTDAELNDFLVDGDSAYLQVSPHAHVIRQVLDRTGALTLQNLFAEDGTLIPCGEGAWMFLHLTFEEYLASRALAKRINTVGWNQAHMGDGAPDQSPSVDTWVTEFSARLAYQEYILLLTGQLDDPIPLLRNLADPKRDDIARQRLALAALAVGEVDTEKIVHERSLAKLVDRITDEVVDLHKQHRSRSTAILFRRLVGALPTLARSPGKYRGEALLDFIARELSRGGNATERAFELLSDSREANARILKSLAGILREPDGYHWSAANAIYKLGERAATEPFLQALAEMLRDPDRDVREVAVTAVGRLGERAATGLFLQALAEMLRDSKRDVRRSAADAICKLGEAAATVPFLQVLAEMMRDPDPHVRRSAAAAVGNLGEKAVATGPFLQALAEMLRDPDPHVRRSAAVAVGNLGEKAAASGPFLQALAEMVRDPDRDVREVAVTAVGKLGEKATTGPFLPALAKMLRNPDPHVRRSAAVAVGNLGEKAAASGPFLQALAEMLRDPNRDVRQTAADAICKLGEAAATVPFLQALAEMLRDPDLRDVCPSAVDAVGKLGEKAATAEIIDALPGILRCNPNNWWYLHAVDAVGKLGEMAATGTIVEALIYGLPYLQWRSPQSIAAVVIGLGEKAATGPFLETLLAMLRSTDRYYRNSSANILGQVGKKVGTRAIVEALAEMLRDSDRDVRQSAANAVGNIGEKAANGTIVEALADMLCDPDKWVRICAADAVGKLGEKAAIGIIVEALAEMLRDSDRDVRQSAANAVGNIGEKAANGTIVEALADMLCDPDKWVRICACYAVGGIGAKAATAPIFETLIKMLQDSDLQAVVAAHNACGELGKAVTGPALALLVELLRDPDKRVRRSAAHAVERIGEKAATTPVLDALTRLLRDPDKRVRRSAAHAVERIGEKAATTPVLVALTRLLRDRDRGVRQSAAGAVCKLGEKAVTVPILDALAEMLRNWNKSLLWSAVQAVSKIGEKGATGPILEAVVGLLRDPDEEVREWGAECLASLASSGFRLPAYKGEQRIRNGTRLVSIVLARSSRDGMTHVWHGIEHVSAILSRLASQLRQSAK